MHWCEGPVPQLAHIGTHTQSRHSKKDRLDYQGWPGGVTDSALRLLEWSPPEALMPGKKRFRWPGRAVASGSPKARRKGLHDQVEWLPPEDLRPRGKV